MTDHEVALRVGVSARTVVGRRSKLGIPIPAKFARRRSWTPAEDALLGTAKDTEIAARLGRALSVVCVRRRRLGIPNFLRKPGPGRRPRPGGRK